MKMENWAGNCLGFLGGCAIGSLIIFLIGAAGIGIDNWLKDRLHKYSVTRLVPPIPQVNDWRMETLEESNPPIFGMTLPAIKEELSSMGVRFVDSSNSGFTAKFPFSKGIGLYLAGKNKSEWLDYALCLASARIQKNQKEES